MSMSGSRGGEGASFRRSLSPRREPGRGMARHLLARGTAGQRSVEERWSELEHMALYKVRRSLAASSYSREES